MSDFFAEPPHHLDTTFAEVPFVGFFTFQEDPTAVLAHGQRSMAGRMQIGIRVRTPNEGAPGGSSGGSGGIGGNFCT